MKEKIMYGLLTLAVVLGVGIGAVYLGKGMSTSQSTEEASVETTTENYNDKTAQFITKTPAAVLDLLALEKPGIYYFGYPTCPWCKELLPILDSVLAEEGQKAYAVNIRGTDYTDVERGKLAAFFGKYSNQQAVAVPFVVKISESGTIKTHIGTLPEHNAPKNKMTSTQVTVLKKQLKTVLK